MLIFNGSCNLFLSFFLFCNSNVFQFLKIHLQNFVNLILISLSLKMLLRRQDAIYIESKRKTNFSNLAFFYVRYRKIAIIRIRVKTQLRRNIPINLKRIKSNALLLALINERAEILIKNTFHFIDSLLSLRSYYWR